MNNQKNRFWTFVLSLMPGAGEMYLGLYRQGVSLMLCFFVVLLVPVILRISALSLLCVILWFYSFLHTHNLRSMSLEEFCQVEDRYLWEGLSQTFQWNSKSRTIVAVALIVIGAFLLWENLFYWLGWLFGGFLGNIMYRLPRSAMGALILILGIWLIRGKKRELDQEDREESVPTSAPVYGPGVNQNHGPAQAPVYQAPAAPDNNPTTPAADNPDNAPACPVSDAPEGKEEDGHADA